MSSFVRYLITRPF